MIETFRDSIPATPTLTLHVCHMLHAICNSIISVLSILTFTDIDDCSPDPCYHGSCVDGVDSYRCTCITGYTGTLCDISKFSDNDVNGMFR